VIILVVTGIGAYASADALLEHAVRARQELDDWYLSLLDAETGARGYVVAGEPRFLEPYESALRRERRQAAVVRGLAVDNPEELALVDVAGERALATMSSLHDLTTLVAAGHRDEAVARVSSGDGKNLMDSFREAAAGLRSWQEDVLARRRAQSRRRAALFLASETLLMLSAATLLALSRRRERIHGRLLDRFAREARQNLDSLSDVAAALAQARTRAQVAQAIVDQGMRATGADTCALYGLNEAGDVLELLGDRGVAPGLLDTIRRISEGSGGDEMFARMRSGTSVWAENEDQYSALFPALASMRVPGPRAKAFWSVPLHVEGRSIGLLGMGFYGARAFSADDRAFVETFTKLCAQALQRAARLERQDEASRWFTTTLRSIGDAVIATDAEGRVTFMNPVAEALTHWTEGEARSRKLDDVFCIISEDTRAPVESPVTKVLREGKIVGLANHTLLRARNGVETPIDDSGAPIRNEAGQLFGVVLVFRSVIVEKRERVRRDFLAKAGEALVSSLDYQTTLANVARLAVPAFADWCAVDIIDTGPTYHQIAVAHVDPHKVQFARELAERYPPDPDATTGVPQVIRSGKSELYSEIPAALLEAGAQDAEHLRIIRELRLESAMVVPLLARGRTLGAMTFVYADSGRRYTDDDLAFAEDFARRAAMAIENAMALREADEARVRERLLRTEAEIGSRAKDEFLATVSHELRTPLNAILGWTITLRQRQQAPDVDRALAIIERSARAQAKLIEDVLDLSRIISGKLTLSLGPTNVEEATFAAVETVTPAAEAKNITIFAEAAQRPLTITADPDRLQQVVWNLLSNAVKFTPKGGKVWVRVQMEGSHILITVTDTGEGIRPEDLPLIFEPFHQADASTTRRHGGLGLGLAIVKQLVSAHGGVVRAESDGAGKGSRFVVELPARAITPAIGRPTRPAASIEVTPAGKHQAPRLDGLRLLVVDDEPDALALVTEVLRERGAEVYPAPSASVALETLKGVKPDVIVSDIGMPDVDGYSLMRKIRALPAELGGRTPAVALTAYARGEDVQRAFAAGYQLHLAKPVEPGQLASVVANLRDRGPTDS
jgi:PAS domain S-box-containing protein